jgi:nucleotide sugar dehydrogenase
LWEKSGFQEMAARGKLTLIGVGRLGLCSALIFEKAGYEVCGVDVHEDYVKQLNEKTFESHEPGVTELLRNCKNFSATCSLAEGVNFSDLLFVCVDTPSTGDDRHYDTLNLNRVLSGINSLKPSNKHVQIMCTVLPGYWRNEGRSLLKDCVNTTLNYNPEFIAQGAIIWGFLNPDVVLIGAETEESGGVIRSIYEHSVENKPYFAVMSPESAEVMKISLNCFITTKIAYANMIGDIADLTPGANKESILDAIGHDSRVGGKCLKAGWSFGGPCFPRDNRALAGYGSKISFHALLSEATDRSNEDHAVFQAEQLLKLNKEVYVFENIAYKFPCDVPITEESAKIKVGVILSKSGKKVILRDRPHILEDAKKVWDKLGNFEYEDISVPRDPKTIDG